jgi:hypothetical protein
MRFSGFLRAALKYAPLAILVLGAIMVMARDGRDFAGTYRMTDVQEQGDMVHLTLHLRLYNNSDSDIKGAIVILRDGPTGVALRGNFPTVKVWPKSHEVRLSQEFTVPKREYEDWLRPPAQPNVVVIYQDAQKQTWHRSAQMAPEPVL